MRRIDSFSVDHEKMLRGIYVSRTDRIDNSYVTTFDIRMKEPNREKSLSPEASHTIEHLAATYLRNDNLWKDNVIYWGPMGCLTGFYFIAVGKLNPFQILFLMRRMFQWIANYEGLVPGISPKECGNYTLCNLDEAKREASRFMEVLNNFKDCNANYPE